MATSSTPDSGIQFPPVEHATPEGLLAVGGDLSVPRLLAAYRAGIFPWYSAGQPILWWSPDPRTVLYPEQLKVSRSLRRTLAGNEFHVTLDTAFDAVMDGCASPRPGQPHGSTWITTEMRAAYARLHAAGHAHSIEAWRGDTLAGGLYGVAIGAAFFGESMFTRETGASKVAFVRLVRQLQGWGFTLVDCQVYSNHLASLGATEIPRSEFLARLKLAIAMRPRAAPWRFDDASEAGP